jgi:hypothetical protein
MKTKAVGVLLAILVASSLGVGYFAGSETRSAQTVTSTTTVTSTAACPSGTACGTFTYAPIGQLRVDSVQALIAFPLGSGQEDVQFAVTVENTGSSPIQFSSDELNSTIATDSTVRRETCNCGLSVTSFVTLNHGQNFTLIDPAAGNGYFYALLRGGPVDVTFHFDWTTNGPRPPSSNSTTVSARFVFAQPPAP